MPGRWLFRRGPMRRPWRLLTLTCLGVVAVPGQLTSPAIAAETDLYVTLQYKIDGAPRRCWDEAEFRRSVAQHVGYDPFRGSAAIHVSVRVGGPARAVDGQVEWRNASGEGMGERRFVAKDGNCFRLLTEMSFAIGLQIELLRPKPPAGDGAPGSAGDGGVPAPGDSASYSIGSGSATTAGMGMGSTGLPPASLATSASPSTATPGPDLAKVEPEHPPNSEEAALVAKAETAPARWPMWLGIGPSLAFGIAPSVTGSARLFIGARRNDLSLELGAEASYPSTERAWGGTGFRQNLLGASTAVCGHRNMVSACVLGKASQVRVSGFGVDKTRSPTGLVAQAGLRLAAAWTLGSSWSATAHVDALGLLTPYTVVLNQVEVWDMPRLGALAGIDVSTRFW